MHEEVTANPPVRNRPLLRSVLFVKLPPALLAALVTITSLAIFIPLNPDMPEKGMDQSWISAVSRLRRETQESVDVAKLDQSWTLAINTAVARHLRFGKEVVFTFGPYGSIYTRSFHPATDRLMILGSLLLAVSYPICLLYLARGRKLYLALALLLFCATFPQPDALFLSYPFMLVVCALRFADHDSSVIDAKLGWLQLIGIAVALSALGLLPLIKGSLLFPTGLSLALLCATALHSRRPKPLLPLLLIPITAAVIFWKAAGQLLTDLPGFFRATMWMISGYTEAMSVPLGAWPVLVGYGFIITFPVVLALIYFTLVRSAGLTAYSKWVLGFLCAAFLLVAFKHGFVRTDHLPIAFDSLAIFIFILSFLYTDRYLTGALCFVLVLIFGIVFRTDPVLVKEVRESFGRGTITDAGHRGQVISFMATKAIGTLYRITYQSARNTYATSWEGLRLRLRGSNALEDQFAKAMANIRSEYAIPAISGTGDIYTYDQAILLASGNSWNPRPTLQSYTAYLPALATINEQHLRGPHAPDWILYDLWALDERLPSIEDGLSWPALLDNYTVSSFDGQFVFMRKNQVIRATSNLSVIYQQNQLVGSTVVLPEASAPLFAEVDLKPTLVGRLLLALYKPPQLSMALKLKDGETRTYRVISNMMVTGFFVSPFVYSTEDFESLAVGDRRFLEDRKVVSISIVPSFGGTVFWSPNYLLTLETYSR